MTVSATSRPVIALGTRLRQRVLAALSDRYEVIETERPLTAGTVAPAARRARALVTLGAHRTDGDLLDALPEVRLIACYGTGYDGIDLAAVRSRGIVVTNNPGTNAASVADLAIALALASTRRVVSADRLVREGRWRSHPTPELGVVAGFSGRRLGVVGLGSIGRLVAQRAAAFGVQLAYWGRTQRPDVPYAFFDSITDLARWADILIVTLRATAENTHLVDATVLDALGPRGHLVNVSRGSIVQESALISALGDGGIAGAALDVFETEPFNSGPMLELANLVLSPHQGGATEQAELAAIEAVLANLEAFFAGRELPNRVDITG